MTRLFIPILIVVLVFFGGLILVRSYPQPSDSNEKQMVKGDPSTADFIVTIERNGFFPEVVEIQMGQSVAWINKDDRFHWPASNIHPTHEIYSDFDPREPISEDESWIFTFKRVGEWRYHDHLMPNKTGTVIVKQ